ncbi:conserved hypothetical protein [Theileria equi strain WA]|uniref:Matrin-type domain-containing protein n=1 Tax=Theileria equi strain WA TaxID=1537102 RepID=L1LC53_THEEQ|nr:conserved hypothetical protein [Theileria equi strain WA]EKX72921.1 conserved hypothetical protein [Theileria equi strain WA]|eukprot:XP_004832373.1 conserved hypothetical protein [Theileria equi strain WA]
MPKFYCEYCSIYLTHSSPAGRKQHSQGRKHINAKVDYYQKLVRERFFQPPPMVNLQVGVPGVFPQIMPVMPPGIPVQRPMISPPVQPPMGIPFEHPQGLTIAPPAPAGKPPIHSIPGPESQQNKQIGTFPPQINR